MSKSCPVGPEWNALVSDLGIGNAMVAYELHQKNKQEGVPTVDQARLLLKEATVISKDEKVVRGKNDYKLKKGYEQSAMLGSIFATTTNTAQQETLGKLMNMTQQYVGSLQDTIEAEKEGKAGKQSISVTTFVGTSDFTGDSSLYESYRQFGNFMHNILEYSQLEAMKEGVTIGEIFTREYFDAQYEKFTKKNPIDFESLDLDLLFEEATRLVSSINSINFRGALIIPELTVMGTSSTGSSVVGRMDLTVIDSLGNIEILDFKTKKMQNIVSKKDGKMQYHLGAALDKLARYKTPIDNIGGTHEEFHALGNRTAIDTWMVQLDAYGNILQQHGMNVSKKSVSAFMYDIDDENNYRGAVVHNFDDIDYYELTIQLNPERDAKFPYWFLDDSVRNRTFQGLKDAVDNALPVNPNAVKEVKAEEAKKKPEETYEINPSEKNMANLVQKMIGAVDGDLKDISDRLSELDSDNKEDFGLIEILKKRKESLITFRNIAIANKSNPTAFIQSSNFFSAMDTVSEDLKKMSKVSTDAFKVYSETNGHSIVKSKNQLTEIHTAFLKGNKIREMVKTMDNIVNEFAENPANEITADSEVRKSIGQMRSDLETLDSNFRRIGLQAGVEIFKTPGKKVYFELNESKRKALEPKLETLKRKRKALEDGAGISKLSTLKDKMYSLASKTYREAKEKNELAGKSKEIAEIDKLTRQIIKIEELLNGFEFTDEMIEKYITSVTNPESLLYIGNSNMFNEDALFQGWNKLETLVASASNSERAVATPTMLLKNTHAQATYNTMNDKAMLEFDRKRKKLLDSMSVETLNDHVSQWRDVVFYNNETGKKETKRMLFLNKPFSEKYENDYKSLQIDRRLLTKELYIAKGKTQEAFLKYSNKELSHAEYETVKQVELDRKRDLENKITEYVDFITENSVTPYTDEFYKIQSLLPQDISDAMQKLYMEQEEILYSVGGKENITDLEDDFSFDRIKEIDVEIKKLRQKAKEENPEYAAYLDKFNELYEYDTNENYYNSRRKNAEVRFGSESKEYKKWLKENTVERPTSQWYADLEELYEQRQFIIDELPKTELSETLSDLFEERAKITRPYKQNGRIQPKYMTDEDIHEYDRLQDAIEVTLEQLRDPANKDQIDKELIMELMQIGNEIKSLTQNKLSSIYSEEFDSRYHNLENLWNLVNANESIRNTAKDAHSIDNSEATLKTMKSADEDLIFYNEQFLIKEEEFKEWYNKNHTSEYESIAEGYDVRGMKTPKEFNYEKLPHASVFDKYMETVPNPKYYKIKKLRKENWHLNGEHLSSAEIESLREDENFNEEDMIASGALITSPGAYNPDFKKGPDGILLPKGLKETGPNTYAIREGFENDPHIDDRFKSIQSNAPIKDFYDSLNELYFGLQKKTEGRKIGYQIPGFSASVVEKIAREKSISKVVQSQWGLFVDKNAGIKGNNSIQDRNENAFGDLGSRIRMRYTQQLPEGMQSEDVISSIMKYSVEAHYNIAMQDVAPMVEGYIDYLKVLRTDLENQLLSGQSFVKETTQRTNPISGEMEDVDVDTPVDMKKRIAELTTVIDIVEFEKRKYVYGQAEANQNRAVKKIMNSIFSYTSFIRIGFDVANQIKNSVAGNTQALIHAGGYDGHHYSRKNWIFGKKKVYAPTDGFLASYFKDWDKVSDLSVPTMLYRFYNPAQKDPQKYFNEIAGTKGRKVADKMMSIQEMGYLLQDKGESEIAVTVMYAVMDNYRFKVIDRYDEVTGDPIYKLDKDGKEVTVATHEIYMKGVGGELIKRNDVEFSIEDEARIRNIIYSEMRRAQGNYASADMTKFEDNVMGKMVFYFRKFLVPQFLNRFGYLRPSWEAGEISMGYWRATMAAGKHFGWGSTLKEFTLGSKRLNKMNMSGIGSVVTKKQGGKDVDENTADFYIGKVAHARRDAFAMAMLTVFAMMALAYVRQKDDDDEEIGMLEGNALRILWGVKGETVSMFPVGGGSEEYIRNFTTAVPFVREATKIMSMGDHIYKYGMAMAMNGGVEPDSRDSDYYHKVYKDAFYVKKSGTFEKGSSKLNKDFMDLTGIRNFRDLFDPSNRIDILKRNQ